MSQITSLGEMINVEKSVVGKPERKRTLGRHRRKGTDKIKIGLKIVGHEGVD
jgi:hypothetical protein